MSGWEDHQLNHMIDEALRLMDESLAEEDEAKEAQIK